MNKNICSVYNFKSSQRQESINTERINTWVPTSQLFFFILVYSRQQVQAMVLQKLYQIKQNNLPKVLSIGQLV